LRKERALSLILKSSTKSTIYAMRAIVSDVKYTSLFFNKILKSSTSPILVYKDENI